MSTEELKLTEAEWDACARSTVDTDLMSREPEEVAGQTEDHTWRDLS
jgi:hypothetical protein